MNPIRLLVPVSALLLSAVHPAGALAQKPGGGQSVEDVGGNVAELISTNLAPLLIVLVGVVGIAAFMARSIGQLVMIVIGGLFAGVFIIEPSGAETLFRNIYDAIF